MILKIINKKVDKINDTLQKANLLELSYILGNKKEIVLRNFLAGVSRGIGIGIGITLISAIIIYILQKIVRLNIPIIGNYISDIVDIVKNNKKY